MPRGVYERKNKKNKAGALRVDNTKDGPVLVSGFRRMAALNQLSNCRLSMSLQVPDGGAEIKLTNSSGRVIGTVQLTTEGLMMSRPNQKKKPDRLISYVSLSKLMELGLL